MGDQPGVLHDAGGAQAFNGRTVWEAAGGTWMGHDIASASKFRASSLFQKFEAEALLAVVERSAVGADEVTDLVMVNMKGPDYTAHAYGPDVGRAARNARRARSADGSVPGAARQEGRTRAQRHGDHRRSRHARRAEARAAASIPTTSSRMINKRFDPEGRIVQYYGDAAEQPDLPRHRAAAVARLLAEGRRRVPRGAGHVCRGVHRGRSASRAGAAQIDACIPDPPARRTSRSPRAASSRCPEHARPQPDSRRRAADTASRWAGG